MIGVSPMSIGLVLLPSSPRLGVVSSLRSSAVLSGVVLSGVPGFEGVAVHTMQGRIPLQVDVVFPEVAVSGPFVTMPSIDPLPCYLLLMLTIFVHMSTSGA